MSQDKIVALHSFPVWLPQTQPWMFNQVKYLPDRFDVHIVCERTENLDQFRLANIHSLRDVSILKYVWQKGMRKMEIPHFQSYLSFKAKTVHPHLIHSHFGEIGWNNLNEVAKVSSKHIVTFYGYDLTRLPAESKKWKSRYLKLL